MKTGCCIHLLTNKQIQTTKYAIIIMQFSIWKYKCLWNHNITDLKTQECHCNHLDMGLRPKVVNLCGLGLVDDLDQAVAVNQVAVVQNHLTLHPQY